jgi:hypothetical protein
MKWIDAREEKPVIPEGQFAIGVIITVHDPILEEVIPGCGSRVQQAHWNGKRFEQLTTGNGEWDWLPCFDVVTHWMYFPEPAPLPEGYRKDFLGAEKSVEVER